MGCHCPQNNSAGPTGESKSLNSLPELYTYITNHFIISVTRNYFVHHTKTLSSRSATYTYATSHTHITPVHKGCLSILPSTLFLLLLPGTELSLIVESFGLLNDLLLPFLLILDASCPIFYLHLAKAQFDVILPSVLGSSL